MDKANIAKRELKAHLGDVVPSTSNPNAGDTESSECNEDLALIILLTVSGRSNSMGPSSDKVRVISNKPRTAIRKSPIDSEY